MPKIRSMKGLHFKLRAFFSLFFILSSFLWLFSETDMKDKGTASKIKAAYGDKALDEIIPLVSFERIPDSALVRKAVSKMWLLDPPSQIAVREEQIAADRNGNKFKIRAVHLKEKNLLATVISPMDTEFSGLEKVPQGTWILYRNYETGKPEYIKIYPRENPELYLSFKPSQKEENRSFISICLFNAYVRKDIPVSLSFDALYYLSLTEMRAITKRMLPWEIFDPPVAYSTVESASDTIRERLKTLVYLDDGGFDEEGRPVHLKDGSMQTETEILLHVRPGQKLSGIIGGVNCSGFAKWIVDGMIRPIAGQGTFIKKLRTETLVPDTYFTKPYADRDLYFGLEWIRNLAAAALTLNVKRTVMPVGSGVDVEVEPFALVPPIRSGNKQDSFSFKGYEKNAGYQTGYLEALLYYLSVSEPGHFYLGAVSRDQGTAALRQYHHIAAFFPYFDILGNFHIDVYENGEETSISRFIQNNKDAFTALVRIRAPEPMVFNP